MSIVLGAKNNMKMLYILNVAKRVNNFSYASMIAAQNCGFDFHIAGNWSYESDKEREADELKYKIKIHQIDFVRKPYSFKNRIAYNQLLKLCKQENFDVIHCNTPIGGLLGRIVGSKCKTKTIIYEAHGFHFYKHAPLINWLIYYPIEKWLAKKTDILITINREDYEIANRKMKLRSNGIITYVPGVGISIDSFRIESEREEIRKKLGLSSAEIGIISLGDLIGRKNYKTSIDAIKRIKYNHIKLFICGDGAFRKRLQSTIIRLGLEDRVFLLGYRDDVKELLKSMDIFLLSSKQEGIPRSTMEAMASGLPCVVSNIRGNNDLIKHGEGGFLCNPKKSGEFAEMISLLSSDAQLRKKMGDINLSVITAYDVSKVINEMMEIYSEAKNIKQ